MTIEEFERELVALVQKIDEQLALQIADRHPRGHALTSQRRYVPDPQTRTPRRPEGGITVHASVTVWFEPVRYVYEDRGGEGPKEPWRDDR